ncbi:MAG: carboxypeptidase-like regulatory domain-containing protein, partial [Bacteroidota bacterium]|nr:carboxypeptidase-like regulatory domain-containing protein [Bacteroidota bacterium]
MIRILLLFGIVGFLLFPTLVLAQAPIEITGSVVESVSKDPVPYASVVVRTLSEDKVITGTTTGEDGTFLLRVNHQDFWLEISFIGFETLRIDSLSVRNGNMNLGVIPLKEKTQRLNEVEVSAERSRVEFKLDKRVFNVGQDIASTGVGALD